VEECYTSGSARASETNALVGPDTPRCGITGKPNHDTVMPAHALVYQVVVPCAIILVHAHCVRHSLYPAILLPQCRLLLHCRCLPHLPLLLFCLIQKLRGFISTFFYFYFLFCVWFLYFFFGVSSELHLLLLLRMIANNITLGVCIRVQERERERERESES